MRLNKNLSPCRTCLKAVCLDQWGLYCSSPDIDLDLSGYVVDLPYRLILQPGWNFIGIPVLDALKASLSEVKVLMS